MEKKRNKITNNHTVISVAGQVIGGGCGILFPIVAAKLSGADVYGEVVYVYTIISLFVIISKCGFENSLVHYMARGDISKEKKKGIVGFGLTTTFAVAMMFFVATCAIGLFFYSDSNTFATMSFIIVMEAIAINMAAIVRGTKDVKNFYIITEIERYGLQLISYLLLELVGALDNRCNLILSYYICFLFMIIRGTKCVVTYDFMKGMQASVDKKRILVYSFPLMFSGILAILNTKLDQFFLGVWKSKTDVAIYNIAVNYSQTVTLMLLALNGLFAATIANLYYGGKLEELKNRYNVVTFLSLFASLVIAGYLLVFAPEVMGIVGDEYKVGQTALILLLLGQVVNAGVGSVQLMVIMTGHSKLAFVSSIIAVAVNLLGDIILIPQYGMNGAAIASALSYIVINIINLIMVKVIIKIHPYDMKFVKGIFIMISLQCLLMMFKRIIVLDFIGMILVGIVYSGIAIASCWLVLNKKEKGQIREFLKK